MSHKIHGPVQASLWVENKQKLYIVHTLWIYGAQRAPQVPGNENYKIEVDIGLQHHFFVTSVILKQMWQPYR